jgi:hypothetical protein
MLANGMNIPSLKYKEWHLDASWQLKGAPKIPNGSYLVLKFYMPDNRRTDLTNKAESIMDCLVDNEILEDDSYQVIPTITLQFEAVDKLNPRCEILW